MFSEFVVFDLSVFEDQGYHTLNMTSKTMTGLSANRSNSLKGFFLKNTAIQHILSFLYLNVSTSVLSALSTTIGRGQFIQEHIDELQVQGLVTAHDQMTKSDD